MGNDSRNRDQDPFKPSDRPGSRGGDLDGNRDQGQQSTGGGQNQSKDTGSGGLNEREGRARGGKSSKNRLKDRSPDRPGE